MKKTYLIALFLISPLMLNSAFAHQSDSVGDYRIEIDWKNKPIVTGESNAIIVYVSVMDKTKEAADQPFNPDKGIEGLKKTLKIKLVVEEKFITLPLQPTDIPGKYESAITPTFSGWSQLNFLGKIKIWFPMLLSKGSPAVSRRPNTATFPFVFPSNLSNAVVKCS